MHISENPYTVPRENPDNQSIAKPPLELWGGVECSVTRVGNDYMDQVLRSGHQDRMADLELFHELGIRTLRYPVLWERTAPKGPDEADWRWSDQRLHRLRQLNIHPIVGLVHHGSGPVTTHLLDPTFPERLAEHAAAVARRYPWIDAYTPVNEILTTARFSALYGHWYPHQNSEQSFVRALVNQCRAVALSMQAVREINPDARLIQTDDLGRTYSTPRLAYQADFDNERRWLGWDLLCGRVGPGHSLWKHLLDHGIHERDLEGFLDSPSPPDIVGVNHYVTSDRFLDERIDRYPQPSHGGNGHDRYADVEAVRVIANYTGGPLERLQEAWERYRLPIAVTEAHLGCTREEQCRWLLEVWNAAREARSAGADVRAVTVWSLLGAYDWSSLLTQNAGHYEPGAFDLRGGRPRPTAIAHLARRLADGSTPSHPVTAGPGWWRRSERLLYPPAKIKSVEPIQNSSGWLEPLEIAHGRPLLITGGGGVLAHAFRRLCHLRGLEHVLLTRRELDIACPEAVAEALAQHQPWAVANAGGFSCVDRAEEQPDACFRSNVEGPKNLAAACAQRNIPLVTFSSDLVFDGSQRRHYVESDGIRPLNIYGRSKAEAEAAVLQRHPLALVVRSSAFFGPWDETNFVTSALRRLREGKSFAAATDAIVSPTYVPDLVHATLDLLIDGEYGVWHLSNEGETSWYQFARQAATLAGIGTHKLCGRPNHELGLTAPRPIYSALGTERAALLPSLERGLANYLRDRNAAPPIT